jgi:hypothetical protein
LSFLEPPNYFSASTFGTKTKSAINLGRTTKRKPAIPEALELSSGTNSPPTESSPVGERETKRDSGKYGTVGRSMFGGVGKQWGSIFIGGAGAGTKNQSARIPVPTVNVDDFPKYEATDGRNQRDGGGSRRGKSERRGSEGGGSRRECDGYYEMMREEGGRRKEEGGRRKEEGGRKE